MEQKKLSGGQFGILTFVMMMAPIVHAVPTRIIDARRASWLLPLFAILPLAVLMFFLFRCLSRMPGWETCIPWPSAAAGARSVVA